MSENVERMVQRTYRYFYDDGLVELGIGLLFLVAGLLLWGWNSIQPNLVGGALLALAMIVVVTGGAFLAKKVVRELKERVTYPRTGYVAYHEGEPSAGRWLVMVAALGLAILGLLFPELMNSMALVEGALLLVILFFLGYRSHVWRFYLVGAGALLLGLAAMLLTLSDSLGSSLVFGGTGLLLLISGAITLGRYLQQHPHAPGQ